MSDPATDCPACPACSLNVATPTHASEHHVPEGHTLYCPACGGTWVGTEADVAQAEKAWQAYDAKQRAEYAPAFFAQIDAAVMRLHGRGVSTTDPFDTADLYNCDSHAESYVHTTPLAAAERAWEEYLREHGESDEITVYAFKRAEWPRPVDIADYIIGDMIDRLSEGYLDPDNIPEPSKKLRKAAFELARTWCFEMKVWHCEQVGSRTMTLDAWRKVAANV